MSTFQFSIVICGNAETIVNGAIDPTGNSYHELAQQAVDAASRVILDAGSDMPIGDCTTDSTFRNWHGGKYAHQSAMYGIGRFGLVCVRAERIDEDGESTAISWREVPKADADPIEALCWSAGEAMGAILEKGLAE